jgi:hypothetical protein
MLKPLSSFADVNMHTTLKLSADSSAGNLDGFFDCFAWENRDVRLDDFPLMGSIWPTVFICVTYIFIVKVVAPTYMRNRQPLDCYLFMMIYNAMQVGGSFSVIYSVITNGWDIGYGWCRLKYG